MIQLDLNAYGMNFRVESVMLVNAGEPTAYYAVEFINDTPYLRNTVNIPVNVWEQMLRITPRVYIAKGKSVWVPFNETEAAS